MKSGLRSESYKRKFGLIIFVQNLIIGCSKKKGELFPKKAYEKEIQKPGFEFNTGVALIDLQTTGR